MVTERHNIAFSLAASLIVWVLTAILSPCFVCCINSK